LREGPEGVRIIFITRFSGLGLWVWGGKIPARTQDDKKDWKRQTTAEENHRGQTLEGEGVRCFGIAVQDLHQLKRGGVTGETQKGQTRESHTLMRKDGWKKKEEGNPKRSGEKTGNYIKGKGGGDDPGAVELGLFQIGSRGEGGG